MSLSTALPDGETCWYSPVIMRRRMKSSMPLSGTLTRKSGAGGSWSGSGLPGFVEKAGGLRSWSRRISLREINEAFADLEKGEVARSVIVFDQ